MYKQKTTGELRKNLSGILNEVHFTGDRIAVTVHGKERAFIVSPEDAKLLDRIEDLLDVQAYEKAKKKADEEGFMTLEELKEEIRQDR